MFIICSFYEEETLFFEDQFAFAVVNKVIIFHCRKTADDNANSNIFFNKKGNIVF